VGSVEGIGLADGVLLGSAVGLSERVGTSDGNAVGSSLEPVGAAVGSWLTLGGDEGDTLGTMLSLGGFDGP